MHSYYLEQGQAGLDRQGSGGDRGIDRNGSAGSGGGRTAGLEVSPGSSLGSNSSPVKRLAAPVPIQSNKLMGLSTQSGTPPYGTLACGTPPLSGHKSLRSSSPTLLQHDGLARPFSLGLGIDLLYTREIKSIIAALSSPQPLTGRCYWISTGWVANAKKYYEALPLPDLAASSAMAHAGSSHRNKSAHRKSTKIRLRRGSDALPPWPQMNSDLTCMHGRLSLAKCPKGKRR